MGDKPWLFLYFQNEEGSGHEFYENGKVLNFCLHELEVGDSISVAAVKQAFMKTGFNGKLLRQPNKVEKTC